MEKLNSRFFSEFSPEALKNGFSNVFSDWRLARKFGKITKIILRAGFIVDGIAFEYDRTFRTKNHGGEGGGERVFELKDNEYVKRIEVSTGAYKYSPVRAVCKISFTTNAGRVFSGGEARECSGIRAEVFEAGKGEQIFALAGTFGAYLASIEGVYVKPEPQT